MAGGLDGGVLLISIATYFTLLVFNTLRHLFYLFIPWVFSSLSGLNTVYLGTGGGISQKQSAVLLVFFGSLYTGFLYLIFS